jgi:putative peptidoglycan lipid II flippase
MAAFVLSRVLGLGREMIIGNQFGTSRELDAYLAAFRIPDLIFQLIAGGALGSAFIPTFTAYLAGGREQEAWDVASSIMNLVVAMLTACAVLAAVLAPRLVTYIVPGFDPHDQSLTVQLMRWMLISPVVFGLSGVIMGILNSYQHFLLPALAPAIYNLSIIGGALLLTPSLGVYGLVIGVIVGSFLHLGIQIPQLAQQGLAYRPLIDVSHPGVIEVGRLMLPRMLGLAAVQVNFLVNTLLASRLAAGSLAALNYAWIIMLLPHGVFAMGIATAAFPTFSDLAARGEKLHLRASVSESLGLILFLSVPSALALILLRVPLTQVLLQRGRFDLSSVQAVAWALQFYALGLVAHSALEIVARTFYSLHDTRTPVAIGAGAMALNITLSLLLVGPLLHGGLALANSLATIVETTVLVFLLRSRLGGFRYSALLKSMARTTVATAAMGLGILCVTSLTGGAPVVVQVGGAVISGAILFLLVSVAVGSEELRLLRNVFRR